ncbi:MAG TPA: PAS domain-containing protein [Methylophilaceae bacterium]|nr:PAS domain-containing protein [Methylophilaceae bacterium]
MTRTRFVFFQDMPDPANAELVLERKPSDWVVIRQDIPGWDFHVVTAYPRSEARRAGLTNSIYQFLIGGLLAAALIIMIFSQLRRLVLGPLGGDPSVAIDLVHRTSMGDLKDDEQVQAEIGTLISDILTMRHNLRVMMKTTEKNAARLALSASVFKYAHEGIFITGPDTRIIDVNPAFLLLTGYPREVPWNAYRRIWASVIRSRISSSVYGEDQYQQNSGVVKPGVAARMAEPILQDWTCLPCAACHRRSATMSASAPT